MNPSPIIALSTCWCSHRHEDGYAMLREMAELGFSHVELSHGIRITLVPGILKAVSEGVVRICSTHNFCPLPTGVSRAAPNLYEPTASSAAGREQWVRHTQRSLDFAMQVGAGVLVTHLGSVRFGWFHPGSRLRRWQAQHPVVTPAGDAGYQRLLARAEARLQGAIGPWRERLLHSLGEVAARARATGVILGFENREKFEELPRDGGFAELFAQLPSDFPGGAWYDSGHAQIKQDFGLMEPRAWLEQNADRLLGFHLHDVDANGRDHRPIGEGRIDFESLSSYWKSHHRLVIELAPDVSAGTVESSKQKIEALVRKRWGV